MNFSNRVKRIFKLICGLLIRILTLITFSTPRAGSSSSCVNYTERKSRCYFHFTLIWTAQKLFKLKLETVQGGWVFEVTGSILERLAGGNQTRPFLFLILWSAVSYVFVKHFTTYYYYLQDKWLIKQSYRQTNINTLAQGKCRMRVRVFSIKVHVKRDRHQTED